MPKRGRTMGTGQTIKLEKSYQIFSQTVDDLHFGTQILINMNGDPYKAAGSANGSTDTGVIFFNGQDDNGQTTGSWKTAPFHEPGKSTVGTGEVWSQNDLINRKRCYMIKLAYTPLYSDITLFQHSASIVPDRQMRYHEPGFIVFAKRAVELSSNVLASKTFETLRTTRLPLKYLKWNRKFKTVMKCPASKFKDRVFAVSVPETRRYNCGQWSSDDSSDNMTSYTGVPADMGPQHGYGGHIYIQFPRIQSVTGDVNVGTLRITAYYKGFLDQ